MKFVSAGVVLVCLVALFASLPISTVTAIAAPADEPFAAQEYYELRIYRVNDFAKMQKVNDYLRSALLPALGRMKTDRIGVFTNDGDVNDHSIFVLIPYKSVDAFTGLNATLAKDEAYQKDAAAYFDQPLKNPLYSRIESRFMKAFVGMPVVEMPAQSEGNKPRIFELRLYESHTEAHAARKVEMFNDGEIQIMRDTELGPVFFGETLIGPQVPNLVYLLSASDEEAHKKHWEAFLKHPEWLRIKDLEQYKDTVSKIQNWMLIPTDYSQM